MKETVPIDPNEIEQKHPPEGEFTAITIILFDLDKTLMPEDEGTDETADKALYQTCLIGQEQYGIDPKSLRKAVRSHAKDLWTSSPFSGYFEKLGISTTVGLCATFTGADRDLQQWVPIYRSETWRRALAQERVFDVEAASFLSHLFPIQRSLGYVAYPDVIETLEKLQESYQLGVLTNGASDLQHLKLETAQIKHYFQTVIVSSDIGVGKPDARIFLHSARIVDAKPQNILFVDDSPQNIRGAKNVGWKTLHLNRESDTSQPTIDSGLRIRTLRDMISLLGYNG